MTRSVSAVEVTNDDDGKWVLHLGSNPAIATIDFHMLSILDATRDSVRSLRLPCWVPVGIISR